mmetsp:Transcript_11181/g.35497  ORF Transcript_11181/g.35497 Transcript_11181/m.35497 type:complete len:206 (-) Transcript_11181:165-782(-)
MSAAVNAAKQAITKYAAPVAEQGSKYAGIAVKEGTTRYEKLMADNAQYILKDPAAADPLLKQWFFTKMSTIPKRYAHAGEELEMVKAKWAKRSDLHMSEVPLPAASHTCRTDPSPIRSSTRARICLNPACWARDPRCWAARTHAGRGWVGHCAGADRRRMPVPVSAGAASLGRRPLPPSHRPPGSPARIARRHAALRHSRRPCSL